MRRGKSPSVVLPPERPDMHVPLAKGILLLIDFNLPTTIVCLLFLFVVYLCTVAEFYVLNCTIHHLPHTVLENFLWILIKFCTSWCRYQSRADIAWYSSPRSNFCPLHLFPSLFFLFLPVHQCPDLPSFSSSVLAFLVSPPLLSGSANSTPCLTGPISCCSS